MNKLFPDETIFQIHTNNIIISECGKYRYKLSRIWNKNKPKILFIMLNPSKADAIKDDPTIRRCINFAKKWGYGGFIVGNLFAYRSTKPEVLLSINNPIGVKNLEYLELMYKESDIIVCAWGHSEIVKKLCIGKKYTPLTNAIGKTYCLELSKDNTPKHPLFLKGNLELIPFEIPKFMI